ncbi:MAG: hypothetical protein RR400_00405, partial [Clostridia bacterium]
MVDVSIYATAVKEGKMKKIKSILIVCLMLVSAGLFSACGAVAVTRVAFEKEELVLEVGDLVDLKTIVTPNNATVKDLVFSSSSESVGFLTPDNKLLATGVGTSVIEARSNNGKFAHLSLIVVEKKEQLSAPTALYFDTQTNEFVWTAVRNASSYTIFNNDKEVGTTARTRFHFEKAGKSQQIQVRANGQGKFLNSELSLSFSFTMLKTPTNVQFAKQTNGQGGGIISWESEDLAFRVVVNGVWSNVVYEKFFELPFSQAGEYSVSVIACGENGKFSSPASEPIKIVKLKQVSFDKIVWDENLRQLVWNSIDSASYKVVVSLNGKEQAPIFTNDNFLKMPTLERGEYQIKIYAVSFNKNVLDASGFAEKVVEVKHKLSTPVVEKYDEEKNQITISGCNLATNFILKINSVQVPFNKVITGDRAILSLTKNHFANAGDFLVTAICTNEQDRFLVNSAESAPFKIIKLAPIGGFKITGEKTATWDINSNAPTFSIKISDATSEKIVDQTEASYDLFDMLSGQTFNFSVFAKGNGNNLLSSEVFSRSIKKLATPVISVIKEADVNGNIVNKLKISGENAHEFVVKVNEETFVTSLDEFVLSNLIIGSNFVSVYVSPEENEIRSDSTKDKEIVVLNSLGEVSHTSLLDESYLEFATTDQVSSYLITINSSKTPLVYEVVSRGAIKTKIKFSTKTSKLFADGKNMLYVSAQSANENILDSSKGSTEVVKLAPVANIKFNGTNRFSWDAVAYALGYDLIVNGGEVISLQNAFYENANFALGSYDITIVAKGNNGNVVNSNISTASHLKTKKLEAPVISFDKQTKEIEFVCTDAETQKVTFLIDNVKIADLLKVAGKFKFDLTSEILNAKTYQISAFADNDSQFVFESDKTLFEIVKLKTPAAVQFASGSLSWTGDDKAESYDVSLDGNVRNSRTTTFSTIEFEPKQYSVVIISKSSLPNVVDSEKSAIKTIETTKKLSSPSNLMFNKAQNKLTFSSDAAADSFDVFVNSVFIKTVAQKSYEFLPSQFNASGTYSISVVANCKANPLFTTSDSSVNLVLKRLDVATNIKIDNNENVSAMYNDASHVEKFEVKVNGKEVSNLSLEDGKISIKIRLIGLGENYLDSAWQEFFVDRLAKMEKPVISAQQIAWTKSPFATLYRLFVKHSSELAPTIFDVQSDKQNFAYDFIENGDYEIYVQAIGDNVKYLTARPSEKTIATKVAEVQINSIVENPQTSFVAVAFSHPNLNIDHFEVFVDGVFAANTNDLNCQISSSLFNVSGVHFVTIKAIGKDEFATINSNMSFKKNTERLGVVKNIQVSNSCVASWDSVNIGSAYFVSISDQNSLVLFSGQVDGLSFDFASYVKSDYIGNLTVSVFALGNNSSLLRGTAETKTIFKSDRPVLSSDLIGVQIADEIATEFFMTIKKQGIIVKDNFKVVGNRFDIPESFSAGEYVFEVYSVKAGNVNSPIATITRTKLEMPINLILAKDVTTSLSWDRQTNAVGYVLSINGMQKQNSDLNKFVFDETIAAGNLHVQIFCNGTSNLFFNSNKSNIDIKKLANNFDAKILNGILTWNEIVESGVLGYDLYVDSVKKSLATSVKSESFAGKGGAIAVGLVAVGDISQRVIDSNVHNLAVNKLFNPSISCTENSIVVGNHTNGISYVLNVTKAGIEILKDFVFQSDTFVIPSSFEAGEYQFKIYAQQSSFIKSDIITFSNTKLAKADGFVLSRRTSDFDIIEYRWNSVVGASGYVLYVNGAEFYRGLTNGCVLSDVVPDGNLVFEVVALGSQESGFSSQNSAKSLQKLGNGFDLRNNNGMLEWNLVLGEYLTNYKMVINNSMIVDQIKTNETFDILHGLSGQLNIKMKAVANVSNFVIDSNYTESKIFNKFANVTNFKVTEGEFSFDKIQLAKEYELVCGNLVFLANSEGIATLYQNLLPEKSYQFSIRATCKSQFLTSDLSESIIVKIIPNPVSAANEVYISTNADKTESFYNFPTVSGATKYTVRIINSAQEVQKHVIATSPFLLTGKLIGEKYSIAMNVVGSSVPVGGAYLLSSAYTSEILFDVLSNATLEMINGVLSWQAVSGAVGYYLYIGDSCIDVGNQTSYKFDTIHLTQNASINLSLRLKAIGDGKTFLTGEFSPIFLAVKPQPPQIVEVKAGALVWNTAEYTYFKESQNKNVFLQFTNGSYVFEKEIGVGNFESGWPKDNNYLEKITKDLPEGTYNLKIRQIGDNAKVITSDFNKTNIQITVCPTPTNVKIRNNMLTWDKVSLALYGGGVSYVVYVFDETVKDWIVFMDVAQTSVDLSNKTGNLLTNYKQIAVAVKGNTFGAGLSRFMTGNMSTPIAITVLGQVSALQTINGLLSWGRISSTITYSITSSKLEQISVLASATSCDCDLLSEGVHEISIKAVGNGSNEFGECIINGVGSEIKSFTKLSAPTLGTSWGEFVWTETQNSTEYQIFRDGNYVLSTTLRKYESDVADNLSHDYSVKAVGNTVVPSQNDTAFISSCKSGTQARTRFDKISGERAIDGKLYWTPSKSAQNPRFYYVDFVSDNLNLRIKVEERTEQIGEEILACFDVSSIKENGLFKVTIRETADSLTQINGIASNEIAINKLANPTNVRLENGELVWDKVPFADGYAVKLISTTTQIVTTGFKEFGNCMKYVSNLSGGEYSVSVQAVAKGVNSLNSSWANGNGIVDETNLNDWKIWQIPTLSLSQINVGGSTVSWAYAGSEIGLPVSVRYLVWATQNLVPPENILSNCQDVAAYEIVSGLKGIRIKTIAVGGNYFASVFSEEKLIEKPLPPTNLAFNTASQIFSWDKVEGSDVKYIVTHSINGGANIVSTIFENNFVPMISGSYELSVQVQKSNNEMMGTSDPSPKVSGIYNLFMQGNGSSVSYSVENANIENIKYRPNAKFVVTENIDFVSKRPIGFDENGNVPFCGEFDGNGKTFNVSFNVSDYRASFVGLFAVVGNNGVVKNIVVSAKNSKINSPSLNFSSIWFGFIAGQVLGNDNTLIENCTINGDVEIVRNQNNETTIGAIAGKVECGTIRNCTNNASFVLNMTTHVSKIGGIAGEIKEAGKILNCGNKGNISGGNYSAGIVSVSAGNIKNCFNKGNISAKALLVISSRVSCNAVCGGITAINSGKIVNGRAVSGLVINCYNKGSIYASNETTEKSKTVTVGGICGSTNSGE